MGGIFSRKKARIVLLGLSNSGKSTILYRLAYDAYTITSPTVVYNKEEFSRHVGGSRWRFEVWDVAGSQKQFWRNYLRQSQRIALAAFVIDASDTNVFEEARTELASLVRLCDRVALVLNKQDLREAYDSAGIQQIFASALRSSPQPVPIFECCAITGEGLSQLLRLAVNRPKTAS